MTEPVLSAPAPRWGWGLLLPHLGNGRCYRCRRPWWAAKPRDVYDTSYSAQFALCLHCWGRSTLDERIHAHAWVTAGWESQEDWPAIEAAVRRDSA